MRKTDVVILFSLSILCALVQVLMALSVMPIVQKALTDGRHLTKDIFIYVFVTIIFIVLKYFLRKHINRISLKVGRFYNERIANFILSSMIQEIELNQEMNPLSLLNNDLEIINEFILEKLEVLIISPFVFLFSSIAILSQNIIIGIIVIPIIFITAFFTFKSGRGLGTLVEKVLSSRARVLDFQKETLEIRTSIKTFDMENFILEKHSQLGEEVIAAERSYYRYHAFTYIPSLVNEYLPILVFILISYFQITNNQLNYGSFASLLQLISFISLPASHFLSAMIEAQKVKGIRHKLDQLEVSNYNESLGELNTSLKLNNVNFNYPINNYQVLKQFSLVINKGDKIAILGTSGSGKTTILNLIMGFYLPDSGEITYNNQTLKDNEFVMLSKSFSYLNDNLYLLPTTVKHNIILNKKESDLYYQLIRDLNIDESKSIDQYSQTFSGGERLKIGVARAVFHRRSIIVLDEPTANLDQKTKEWFRSFIQNTNQTVLIVTHDEETAKVCNRIINLDRGRSHEKFD